RLGGHATPASPVVRIFEMLRSLAAISPPLESEYSQCAARHTRREPGHAPSPPIRRHASTARVPPPERVFPPPSALHREGCSAKGRRRSHPRGPVPVGSTPVARLEGARRP